MPGRFLEIPVFLGDYFIMPHPVYSHTIRRHTVQNYHKENIGMFLFSN